MGMLKISVADKRIMHMLEEGRAIHAPEVQAKIRDLVTECLNDVSAYNACRGQGLGVSELCRIYTEATEALGVDRVINHGGPIIATSLVFMDIKRFPAFVQAITSDGTLNGDKHLEEIVLNARDATVQLRDHAFSLRGRPGVSSGRTGCLIPLILVVMGSIGSVATFWAIA
jgi:hypothetical protein